MDYQKHGIKISREEMNRLKNKENVNKFYKPFNKGTRVIVTDPSTGEQLKGTVISFDKQNNRYDIKLNFFSGIIVSPKYVKGWWNK